MKTYWSRLTAALLALLLCMALVGCGAGEEPQQDGPEQEDPAGTETQTPPAGETESPEDEPQPALTPVDISTDGGVVVVGVIGRDENGWYLTPQQPLNVEFRYFDEPSQFDGQTRIHLFDPREDGVDKSLYLGETVTVSGNFQFYRDYFDRLYMMPYSIVLGQTVEQSHAAPQLQPPQKENRYDPSVPLPKYLLPMVRDGHYVYNAFMLSTETLELMGNDFVYFYLDFMDAFLNYREQCPCPKREYAEMLPTILWYESPLYAACAENIILTEHYDAEAGTLTIPYKYGEEEHLRIVDQLITAADELLATTAPGQSEKELARNIYHEICIRMTYDYSALTDLERKNTYYAYLYNSGVCTTFANVYNQLLTQVGIESSVASGDTKKDSHAWSIVTIDGKRYFCDPTYELAFKDGTVYCYFGTSYEERMNSGAGINGIFGGRYFSQLLDPEEFPDMLSFG